LGINKENNVIADLQVGPTSMGMVRLYISAEGFDYPMDFHPEEAEEIAQEIILAAKKAKNIKS